MFNTNVFKSALWFVFLASTLFLFSWCTKVKVDSNAISADTKEYRDNIWRIKVNAWCDIPLVHSIDLWYSHSESIPIEELNKIPRNEKRRRWTVFCTAWDAVSWHSLSVLVFDENRLGIDTTTQWDSFAVLDMLDKDLDLIRSREDSDEFSVISFNNLQSFLWGGCIHHKRLLLLTTAEGWNDSYKYIFPLTEKYELPMHIWVSPEQNFSQIALWEQSICLTWSTQKYVYPIGATISSGTWYNFITDIYDTNVYSVGEEWYWEELYNYKRITVDKDTDLKKILDDWVNS